MLYSFRCRALLEVSRPLEWSKGATLYLVEIYIIATLLHFLGDC